MSATSVKFWRATGSGPVAETFTPGQVVKIAQVRFGLSKTSGSNGLDVFAASDTFSARHISAAGDALSGHYVGASMYLKSAAYFDSPLFMDKGGAIEFSYPNADEATWGLEVAYEVFGGSQAQAQGLADSAPQPSKGAGRKGGASNG